MYPGKGVSHIGSAVQAAGKIDADKAAIARFQSETQAMRAEVTALRTQARPLIYTWLLLSCLRSRVCVVHVSMQPAPLRSLTPCCSTV